MQNELFNRLVEIQNLVNDEAIAKEICIVY